MSQTLESPAPERVAPVHRPRWVRIWRATSWVLLVGWVIAIGIALSLGRQDATPAQLRGDVAEGQVDEVLIDGGLYPDLRGRTTVVWRTGPLSRYETLMRVSDIRALEVPVVDSEVTDGGVSLLGRDIDGGGLAILGGLTLWLGSIGVLALSPWLWRGTAAGWAWPVLLLPPYGPVAYLIAGGPTGILGPPRSRSLRLTGGLSFFLCLLVGSWVRG